MDWQKLMSKKRLCQSKQGVDKVSRSDFQRDYDRIAFSSPFRRLQDKAQVFPLSDNDYVRTRLTHSLETSCVGRTLGSMAGEEIIKKYKLTNIDQQDFSTVTSTACLAHDIGNTPLGHSGEYAIREWFSESNLGKEVIASISGMAQRNDLLKYQGNAQGFRYLSKLQWPASKGGLQLTCATLGAFSKYPRKSYFEDVDINKMYKNKFSFFSDDELLFIEVAEELGLACKHKGESIWSRHPLAYLVEAADDICYHIIDVEDGHRVGQISTEEAKELLLDLLDQQRAHKSIKHMRNDKDIIECLRAISIASLVNEVAECFKNSLEEITDGSFSKELTSCISRKDAFARFKKLAEDKIYTARRVVEIEVAGFSVISKLLDSFVFAVEEKCKECSLGLKMSPRARSILHLIPESFIGEGKVPSSDPYLRTLKVVDYVSGMTDSFSVSVFKKISGILI